MNVEARVFRNRILRFPSFRFFGEDPARVFRNREFETSGFQEPNRVFRNLKWPISGFPEPTLGFQEPTSGFEERKGGLSGTQRIGFSGTKPSGYQEPTNQKTLKPADEFETISDSNTRARS